MSTGTANKKGLILEHEAFRNFTNQPGNFTGTSSPRQLRAIDALMTRINGVSREELDRICGASNSPEVVRSLRGKGLDVPCLMVDGLDRDGKPCRFGVYWLTAEDAAKLKKWLE